MIPSPVLTDERLAAFRTTILRNNSSRSRRCNLDTHERLWRFVVLLERRTAVAIALEQLGSTGPEFLLVSDYGRNPEEDDVPLSVSVLRPLDGESGSRILMDALELNREFVAVVRSRRKEP